MTYPDVDKRTKSAGKQAAGKARFCRRNDGKKRKWESKAGALFLHDFADEQAALEYAISNQRNRRNLTDADILRCVGALDKRKPQGGDRKSEEIKTPDGVMNGNTSAKTAELVGVSPRKVERVRTVLDHASPETLAAKMEK